MEKEIWKEVIGYEGLYEISSLGRVKRLSRVRTDSMGRKTLLKEIILKNRISKQTGYPSVALSKDGIATTFCVHKLIADAFIPNPDNLPCVNHIDEDRSNSVLSNLERCTYSYNNSYGRANEKRKNSLRASLCGKHKAIYQFNLNGELIKKFDCGVSQLEELLCFNISGNLNGKSKTAGGYIFSYSEKVKYVPDLPQRHQKYVIKIDKDDKEIERYKSISEAGNKNGFNRKKLTHAKEINGVRIVEGMRFIVEQKENEYIPKGHKGPRPDLKGKGTKPVCQYTKDGEFVQEFASTTDAASSLGKKTGSDITNCCKQKLKTACGFIWRYKGEPAPTPFRNDAIRKIKQYSFDGELITTHESITGAIKSIGHGTPTCIGNNLAGRSHSAYGYVWKYAE